MYSGTMYSACAALTFLNLRMSMVLASQRHVHFDLAAEEQEQGSRVWCGRIRQLPGDFADAIWPAQRPRKINSFAFLLHIRNLSILDLAERAISIDIYFIRQIYVITPILIMN